MRDVRQRWVCRIAATAAAGAAAVTSLMAGWGGVADLAAGIVLGVLTTAGLASMSAAIRGAQPRVLRVLVLGLHLLKYPLILVLLYLLLVVLRRNALLVMGGYTLSLIAFLAFVGLAPRGAKTQPEA
ncbi:MAG: hypothetical protein KKI08_09960 [Armatimonadetes bacterium]|nr:hypothetical protein [Armatimonadota bacterium]